MNRLAELLRELKNHVGETYNTLDKGSTGKNIRHDANALAKTLKSSFPMLEKDPQYVSADDLINSGFGVMPLSTKLPATAFSEAHALAQKNAALPIEQGGLGLHPDNTAMERARALGFDVDTKFYHGTNKSFDEFKPSRTGIYFTDSKKLSEEYGKKIKEVFLKKGNSKEYDAKGNSFQDLDTYNFLNNNTRRMTGESSVIMNNFKDNPNPFLDAPLSKVVSINRPSQIRSINAAFDPIQKNSANILASLLLGIGLAKDEK